MNCLLGWFSNTHYHNTADTKLGFGIYSQICVNAFPSISYHLDHNWVRKMQFCSVRKCITSRYCAISVARSAEVCGWGGAGWLNIFVCLKQGQERYVYLAHATYSTCQHRTGILKEGDANHWDGKKVTTSGARFARIYIPTNLGPLHLFHFVRHKRNYSTFLVPWHLWVLM